MAEHGIDDYAFAKKKAAARLGVSELGALPTNVEIDDALAEYQRLFVADDHFDLLSAQRRCAIAAMQLLQAFNPRLVGPVLGGTATAHQTITLHVFADSVEQISLELLDRKVPYRLMEQRVRVTAERHQQCAVFCLNYLEFEIEAIVFPEDGIRQAPMSASDGRPMRRGTLKEVQALLAAQA
jgi:hypothetical protein